MTQNIYDLVPPSELTEIARYILTEEDLQDQQAAEDGQRINSLGPWFPMDTDDNIEVEWDEALDTPYVPAIPVRGFDTPVPEGSLPGTQTKRARMMPMSIGYTVGELQMILNRAGTDQAAERKLMLGKVDVHIERGMRGAMNRAELLKSNLLVNGGFTFDENGVQETVTVGRDVLNEPTAGVAWSNLAGADPHDDEHAALDRLETFGLSWADCVVLASRPQVNHYRKIEAVKEEMGTFRVLPGRASMGEVNDLRQGRELPPILVLNRQVRDPNGVNNYLIPNNFWMIVPRPGIAIGKTVWGSPGALEVPGVDIARDDRPGPVALIEVNATVPPKRRTIIDALSLPFFQAPNWTIKLDTVSGL